MTYDHQNFTMSFAQAREVGIDYRDYEKVDCLPLDTPLIAVAGIWGDYQNIRCLFVDGEGNGYLRNIKGGNGIYVIRESGVNAKEIEVGEWFELETK